MRRHAGMMFVADDLVAWLVEEFVRAARRPILLGTVVLAFVASACLCLVLSGLVFRGWWQGFFQSVGVSLLFVGVINLGILAALRGLIEGPTGATVRDEALQSATTAAVQRTAEELRPRNDKQAEQLAMAISQVFGKPMRGSPLAGDATVLGALQASIATQLAVLNDASLTGTGQSSADFLGVPGTAVAQKLTVHLLREIMARGASGGPLFPLASPAELRPVAVGRRAHQGDDWRRSGEAGPPGRHRFNGGSHQLWLSFDRNSTQKEVKHAPLSPDDFAVLGFIADLEDDEESHPVWSCRRSNVHHGFHGLTLIISGTRHSRP